MLDHGKTAVVGGECVDPTQAYQIHGGVCELFPRLLSDHEEADTRMILHHATHAFESYSDVTIYSPDTDFLVIATYHYRKILQSYTGDETLRMWLHTGNGLKDRYVPVHK